MADHEWAYQEALRRIGNAEVRRDAFLDLSNLGLTSVPPEVEQLSALTALDLDNNELTSLPLEMFRLRSLTRLDLCRNQLTTIPPEIGNLSALTSLRLDNNRLTQIPPEIGTLSALTVLRIYSNRLTSVPAEIGNLASLKELYLHNNRLVCVPAEIGKLSALAVLHLYNNQLTIVSSAIGQLSSLTDLNLQTNQLRTVPPEIGLLTTLRTISLRNNTLNVEMNAAYRLGTEAFLEYLRGLLKARVCLEAKLVAVGEGNVGKSCLLAALRGEAFRHRDTTHGIERQDVPVIYGGELDGTTRPDVRIKPGTELTLHGWDFGGQPVYRVTHQFFFSRRTLYLLVWNARDGIDKCDVVGWLERLRLRVGNEARVLIVCTQCETVDRVPRIPQAELLDRFGDLIPPDGFYEVDSQTGRGIDGLWAAVARQAARLPHVGEPFPATWQQAREAVLGINRRHIEFDTFRKKCREWELKDTATRTLASMLNALGDIVWYGDDETLSDMVVLKPEWLSKTIGFVLEDAPTLNAAGVLDHRRLRAIWFDDRKKDDRIAEDLHPFFLRLMETFDVSYRLDHDGDGRSLMGELVPNGRPDLPWDQPPFEHPSLRLCVAFDEDPPGLMPWLIVRHHRRRKRTVTQDAGLHWQKGLFLHDPQHGTALLELRPRELLVTVSGDWPQHLMSVLQDSIVSLFEERWPGLCVQPADPVSGFPERPARYQLTVPCPTVSGGEACLGRFDLAALRDFQSDGETTQRCLRCRQKHDISALLTGRNTPQLHLEVRELREQLATGFAAAKGHRQDLAARTTALLTDQLAAHQEMIEKLVSQHAEAFRLLLKALESESREAPRLFTLFPDQWESWKKFAFDPRYWGKSPYRLTLWCEMPDEEHPLCPLGSTGDKGDSARGEYVFTRPGEFLQKIAPMAKFAAQALKLVLPITGAVAKQALDEAFFKGVSDKLDLMKTLGEATGSALDGPFDGIDDSFAHDAVRRPPSRGRLEGASLREFHALLHDIDPKQHWRHLLARKFDKTSGDYVWVCKKHQAIFDPPLPDPASLRPLPEGPV